MFTEVTLTGTFKRANSESAKGTITITPSATMTNGSEFVSTTPIVAQINGEGELVSVKGSGPLILVANDDPGTEPKGTFYKFFVNLDNTKPPGSSFSAIIPHASPTIDFEELVKL